MAFVKPEDVLDAAKGMLERGLVSGTAGNVSGRIDENRVCLTPSSVSYETMTLDDLVITDLDGNVLEGRRARRPCTCRASASIRRSAA
jgi:ribulose-5-phosphate 4-epimerase/fuculose-1-phosphate aldolase